MKKILSLLLALLFILPLGMMTADTHTAEAAENVVYVKDGEARLADGTLAGSVLRMNRAVQNTVEKVGVPFTKAVDFATINPARMLGIDKETGSIAVGKRADFTVINENYDVLYTVSGGKVIYKA